MLAPGFEPIVKIPLGLVLRRFEVAKLGLVSSLVGYAALAAGAAVAFLGLWAGGAVEPDDFFAGSAAEHLAHPPAPVLLISFCGALAGVVIQAAYRRSVIAGALIAMRMIDAAAGFGIAVAAGRPGFAAEALERLGLDIAFILVAGVAVFWTKQRLVHRRAPLH